MVMRKVVADRAVAVKSAPRKRARSVTSQAGVVYAVHPGVMSLQRWIRDLPSTTGRSPAQWVALIRQAGPADEHECRLWLKETYAIGGSNALWLAAKAFGNHEALAEASPEGYLALAPQYVEQMFSGSKARLRPLYDQVVTVARQLGCDVQICPSKTAVSVYRRRLFARITSHTPRRLDLGLSLAEEPHTSRLCLSPPGSGCDRITHFVALAQPAELDLQVRRWLKQAYDRG